MSRKNQYLASLTIKGDITLEDVRSHLESMLVEVPFPEETTAEVAMVLEIPKA